MADHVEQSRADDRPDQRPEDHRAQMIDRDAALGALVEQDPRPEHVAHRDADPVRAETRGRRTDRWTGRGWASGDLGQDGGQHAASLSAAVERGGDRPAEQQPPDHI